jgi:hypothetical protein
MSWLIAGDEKNGLLDIYTGAAAAYSLRNLAGRAGKTANVVRVRRSSDNTEQDFTATQVTDGSLATFCGAGNGFVRTWYDQSGNGHDAIQTTTANQPQIVSSGVLVTENSKPSLIFDGTNDRLVNSTLSYSQPDTAFAVCKRDSATGSADTIFDSYNNVQHVLYNTGTVETTNQRYALAANVPLQGSAFAGASLSIISGLFNGATSLLHANGSQIASGNAGSNGLSGLSIGNLRGNPSPAIGGYEFTGKISELILYASNQSANRTAIESNINAHYAIY